MNVVSQSRDSFGQGVSWMFRVPDEEPFRVCGYGRTLPDHICHDTVQASPVTRIEYILSGGGILSSRDYSCVVHAGETYILHQGNEYNIYGDKNNPIHKVWIDFSGTLVQRVFRLYRLDYTLRLKDTDSSPYIHRMHTICENTEDSDAVKEKVSGMFCELVHFLARQQTDSLAKCDLSDKLRRYLDVHVKDSVSIDTLCQYFDTTPTNAIRVFKHKFGITPYQYLLRLKLEMACTLLCSSNFSIENIAEQLGFCSTGHFSEIFYQYNDMRPSVYRKMSRNAEQENV